MAGSGERNLEGVERTRADIAVNNSERGERERPRIAAMVRRFRQRTCGLLRGGGQSTLRRIHLRPPAARHVFPRREARFKPGGRRRGASIGSRIRARIVGWVEVKRVLSLRVLPKPI